MIDSWRQQRARVSGLSRRAEAARERQRNLGRRLQQEGRRSLQQVETLAWFGVTGFVWGARVQDNRQEEGRARPLRELAGAAWLVLSWRRLPQRLRRLSRNLDPAAANLSGRTRARSPLPELPR